MRNALTNFNEVNNEKIRLAIQKSGRLHEESIKLLKECAVMFEHPNGRLIAASTHFPLEVLFLRDDDIPGYIDSGVADIGIVGKNVWQESGYALTEILPLGFGKCRLSIAVPKGSGIDSITQLEGKHIATSYPNTLLAYLQQKGINAQMHEISGSVEVAPAIGLAHAICDIVSSGSTLISNGLVELETIMHSQAVLLAAENISDKKRILIERLVFRLKAVLQAKNNKYIVLNAPNEKLAGICRLIPGIKSPTIVPLADEGWSSIHSVVRENDFWDIIESLRDAGAQGILVIPIEKMIQ